MKDARATGAAERMAVAARRWSATLDAAGRSTAIFPFEAEERFVWAYTPDPPRRGLSLANMTPEQREAAFAMVAASMSARGAAEVRAIIDLEPILGDIERRAGRTNGPLRDPGRYWFAMFGAPGGRDPWAWRLGGHHVAVAWTVVDRERISGAPSFLGANPSVVPDGPSAGHRAIDGEERLARDLLASLSDRERGRAIVDPVAPADLLSGHVRHAILDGIRAGIRHGDLDAPGQAALERLIRHYLDRSTQAIADAAWAGVLADGLDAVTFAWAGGERPGQGHYYAIRGGRFLIEYDNTQDGANHVHSVWRDLAGDWGEDLLAAHHRAAHPAR